jgi:hypothetical protein
MSSPTVFTVTSAIAAYGSADSSKVKTTMVNPQLPTLPQDRSPSRRAWPVARGEVQPPPDADPDGHHHHDRPEDVEEDLGQRRSAHDVGATAVTID